MVSVSVCDFPVLNIASVTNGYCLEIKQAHRAVLVEIWCGLTFFWYWNYMYNDPEPKIKFAVSWIMPFTVTWPPPQTPQILCMVDFKKL